MKKFAIILNNEIVTRYEAEEQVVYGGPWGAPEAQHVEYDYSWDFIELQDGLVVEDLATKETLLIKKEEADIIALGEKAELYCRQALNYIRGYNIQSNLTTEQINTLKTDFAVIHQYLSDGQPWGAIVVLSTITNQDFIELKDKLIEILNRVNN